MARRPRIPVTVLTGFLGSGKTTVLNRLLRHPGMSDAAVIVNELGEVGLDHLLVRAARDNVRLLASGCLCCTINDSLGQTLAELWGGRVRAELPPFERVLIETTGLAEPGPILQTITTDRFVTEHFVLGGVVTCVDAAHAPRQLEGQPEAVHQAAVADRLLLTKTDLVSAADADAVAARLAALNPGAPVQRVVRGEVEPGAALGAGPRAGDDARRLSSWLRTVGADHHRQPHGAGPHEAAIRAHVLCREPPTSWAGLAAWCELMGETHGADLLRVKGLVGVAENGRPARPVVVHGVHRIFDRPVRLDEWPDADHGTRLVVIARGLDADYLQSTLAVLDLPPGSGRPASLAEAVAGCVDGRGET